MDAALHDQIRYLELRLAGCRPRPELHHHQIPAYERQLDLARASTSALGYLEAMERTGTTLEIARAEWMDRYRNWGAIYRALADERKHRAARMNYDAAAQAEGLADFTARVSAAKLVSTAMHQAADASAGLLPGLLVTLLDWASEAAPAVKDRHRDTVSAMWARLLEHDPGCTWQRVCEHPPYRRRIPFDDERMRMIGAWLREAVGAERCDGGARAEPAPVQDDAERVAAAAASQPAPAAASGAAPVIMEVPSAQQAARSYHLTYAALAQGDPAHDSTRRLYERIFELEQEADSGPAFLRRMAEEDMYSRLSRDPQLAVARQALTRCQGQPHMEHHYTTLIQALEHSASPTAIEYELERLGEYFHTEIAWNDILLRYATKALTATSAYPSDRSDARRQTIRTSYRLVCELFGRGWDSLLATPRIWDFFCNAVFVQAQRFSPQRTAGDGGARLGEVGLPIVELIRQETIAHAIERIEKAGPLPPEAAADPVAYLSAHPVFATPEDMKAHLTELFREAMAGAEPEATPGSQPPAALMLWDQPVALDDVLTALTSPPRPRVDLTTAP